MVQVIKDPLGTKGARRSTQISIAGRMLVYLPHDPHVGISQKIESEEDRISLRERVLRFSAPDEKGGFIVRTQAEGATDDELQADQSYLRTLWSSIQDKRSEEHTSELQSLMRISYDVFCLKKKTTETH